VTRSPDTRLIERTLAGDDRAAGELSRQTRDLARRILRRWFWCSEDVEDCAQEVVLRVMSHLHQLRDPARLDGWVATIARNVASAFQKDSRTLPLPIDGTDGGLQPASCAQTGSLGVALEKAKAGLSAGRQELLDMRYRDGFGYGEIADHLQTTVPIVRRRLQGARDQLRKEVLKHMASEQGDAIGLGRQDLDCLYGAASLVVPEAEGSLAALHLGGKRAFGGTTHRAAVATLSLAEELPALALDPGPFLRIPDHADVKTAFLGWDEEGVRLSLDDGTVLQAYCLDRPPPNPKAWAIPDWPLPHAVDASRAEMLELAEHIAGAGWGGGEKAEGSALGCLTIMPGVVAATVLRRAPVTFTLSGQLGCVSETDGELVMLLNRAYLRDCLAALPRAAERVRLEFGGALNALRFSTPACPGLVVAMMPIHPDHLDDGEKETWAEALALQARSATPGG
jgi:RNA polymerase sigma-70 factor (ECF subfamily)